MVACDWLAQSTALYTTYAVAQKVQSPSTRKATQAHASLAPRSLQWINLQRNNQQKVGKKDTSNSCPYSAATPLSSLLLSPDNPGSYPYVDCCLLLSQLNDALRPSNCRLPIPVLHGRKASRSVHCLNRPSLDPSVACADRLSIPPLLEQIVSGLPPPFAGSRPLYR